jgi:hypothetical protein
MKEHRWPQKLSTVRYDVITMEKGRPQPRQSFGAVDAAAKLIAQEHIDGHTVKCLTNALTEKVNKQRQEGLAKRVNGILAEKGFTGDPWQP